MTSCELSIIIVNYKNQHLITQCVQSIIDNEKLLDYEILVIDNNSQDNSEYVLKNIYPQLRWFQMGYNSGFGRANNVGIREAKGELILLLNSDVIVKSINTIFDCVKFLKSTPNSNRTILGTRLVNMDNSYQETLRLEFPGILNELKANPLYILLFQRILNIKSEKKEQQFNAHYKSGEVAWINAAFLVMKRESIQNKQLYFDEDFFLYGEDLEWSWRAKKKGMKFYHWCEKELLHYGSASMPTNELKRSQIIVSDWLYIKKTRGTLFLYIILIINSFTVFSNIFLNAFARLRRKQISENTIEELQFQYIYRKLLYRYGIKIAHKKKLSSGKIFFTNCYENPTLTTK